MRRLLTFVVVAVITFVPHYAFAQESSLFGPIIPEVCKCKGLIAPDGKTVVDGAPGYGCVLQTLQNGINVAVAIAVVITVLAFVYAGFIFMTSGGSAEGRLRGRNVLLSTVVGLLVLLGAWLGVDFVMKVVYNPQAAFSGQNLGPWNSIWAADPGTQCLAVTQPRSLADGVVDILFDRSGGGSGSLPQIGQARAPCPDSNPGCSVPALTGQGLTQNQARVLSCIAMTESSGRPGARTNDPNSTACGLYQITRSNWNNLNLSANCRSFSSCTNAQCNLQAAVLLYRQSGYQPWSGRCTNRNGCNRTTAYGQHWNPNAVACVRTYDPTARI